MSNQLLSGGQGNSADSFKHTKSKPRRRTQRAWVSVNWSVLAKEQCYNHQRSLLRSRLLRPCVPQEDPPGSVRATNSAFGLSHFGSSWARTHSSVLGTHAPCIHIPRCRLFLRALETLPRNTQCKAKNLTILSNRTMDSESTNKACVAPSP